MTFWLSRYNPGLDVPRNFGGGGGGSATPAVTTTTTELPPEVRRLYNLALPASEEFAKNPPTLYEGSLVTPFDPLQLQGQESVLAAAGDQARAAQSAAGFSDFALNDALQLESNPYLQRTVEAALDPITEDFTQSVLPNIRSGSITAGGFGGSRQDIATQRALDSYLRQAGDTTSQIATRGYEVGLDAATKALGFLPNTLAALTTPGAAVSAVGDIRRGQAQELLDEAAFRDYYEQTAPFLAAKEVIGVGGAIPGGSTTVTGVPGRASGFAQGVSGALGGASLAAGLGFAGPTGLAVGGSLGLLASMIS